MLVFVGLAVPIALFMICLVASWLLFRLIMDGIERWAKGKTWPADAIVVRALRQLSIAVCVVVSAWLGLMASSISGEWKSRLTDSLWTFLVLAVMLAVLSIVRGITGHFGQRLNLPGAVPVIKTIMSVTIITVAGLIILGIWGAPTSPLILLISGVSILVILVLRDAGPDFIAALQLGIWEHIRLGEIIRLQDGQQGAVSKMGWHNVEILTPNGDLLIIPNSKLIKQIVTKFNQSSDAVKASLEFFEKQTSPTLCQVGQNEPCDNLASTLSKREMEVAELVSQGATNKELAQKLFISENTAKVHIKNILHKLELKNRQQLAVLAASHLKKKN